MTFDTQSPAWDGQDLIQAPPAPRLPQPYTPAPRPAPGGFRVPPQAIEVEKHVIGALFLDPDALAEASGILTPDDWYLEKHTLLYSAALSVHRARLAVDLISVSDELKKRGTFDAAGGDAYLMEISSEVVSSANVVQHAGIIKEKAGLRNMISLATRILEQAYSEPDIGPVVDAFEKAAVAARAGSGITKGLRILSPDIWMPRAQAAYDRKHNRGLSTGWEGFDQLYTLVPAETNIWTGMPGHGKSEALDALAVNAAELHGWIIGYYSPENDQDDHTIKLVEKKVGKPVFGVGRMTRQEYDDAIDWVNEHFRWLDQQDEGCTFAQVLTLAERVYPPLNALVVDPWNMLESDRARGMLETDYILHCLRLARRWTKRTGISLHIVAHPAKMEPDWKTGEIRVPGLYDISGSAHWFNAIDNGFTVYIDPETGLVMVIVHKIRRKRTGRVGKIPFHYDIPTGRYRTAGPPEFRRGPDAKGKAVTPKARPTQKNNQPPVDRDGEPLPF